MPADVTLILGGQAWDSWVHYELDADYLVAADGWTVRAHNPSSHLLATLVTGTLAVVQVAGVPVLRGLLERVDSVVNRNGHELTLSGRDLSAPLADCTPGLSWTLPRTSLKAAAELAIAELGVAAVVDASAEALVPRSVIKAEAGETYWAVLARYAKKHRLGLWMSPTGVLRIGRPTYVGQPVAELRVGTTPASRADTNVLSLRYSDDVSGRRSPVTVVGQSAGSSLFAAAAQVSSASIDATLQARGLVRPMLVDDGDVGSVTEATARARFEVSQRTFQGVQVEVQVQGNLAAPGVPWSPDQLVSLCDEIHGLVGLWWVRARRMTRSRDQGAVTHLVLHPPNLYLPAA